MKKLGRKHRPFFRICAVDGRSPRDGRVLEEIGTYDPMISDADARVALDHGRIQYWLGVGAQMSDKVQVLVKKYGPEGTHLEAREAALAKLAAPRVIPDPGEPAYTPEVEKTEAPAAAEGADPPAATEEAPQAAAEVAEEVAEEVAQEAAEEKAEEAAEETEEKSE
jgi:small subunit ribosomal protein S16